jgi:hypothetical protein
MSKNDNQDFPHGVLTYGTITPESLIASKENFGDAGTSTLSYACTPIELLSLDEKKTVLFTASGFFYIYGGTSYLVTNWHVVSGRNIFTDNIISSTGFTPKLIRFYGSIVYRRDDGQIFVIRQPIEVDVSSDLMAESAPIINGQNIDLWVYRLPLGTVTRKGTNPTVPAPPERCFSAHVNEGARNRLQVRAGNSCIVLGYPFGRSGISKLPIWKQGAIASEPMVGVDGRPIFLCDIATTEAMSGSPVFYQFRGMVQESDGKTSTDGTIAEFIGVYAGRLQSKSLERTNIGYVWYASLIDKIISEMTM